MGTDIAGVATALRRAARGQDAGPGAYAAARRLHIASGGISSSMASQVERRLPGTAKAAPQAPVDPAALAELRRDGITVLPWRLDDAVVDGLQQLARTVPLGILGTDQAEFERLRAEGPLRYADLRERIPMGMIDRQDLIEDAATQRILADPRLSDLAGAYLGCAPVAQDPSAVWTFGGRALQAGNHPTRSATQFHWDLDGVTALRVHIYLTDVGPDDAPMRYARGSHRLSRRRIELVRRGIVGLDDGEILSHYGTASERVITGPAGTVFMSNPLGFHRGSPITPGHERLFFVFAFTGPVLAYPYRPLTVTPRDPVFAARLAAGDPTLQRFAPRPVPPPTGG